MTDSETRQELSRLATTLLLAVARGETWAVHHYDALLFPLLNEVALRRGAMLAADAAARVGTASTAANVRSIDLEELASASAYRALERARASALRFDPERGDGASWALGALGYAYLDVARELARSRRLAIELPSEDLTLHTRSELEQNDPAVQAEVRDAISRALASLTDDERYVILATQHYGLSYREVAELRFGNEEETKRVDRLLQSARSKLRDAHQAWLQEK